MSKNVLCTQESTFICPACRGDLLDRPDGLVCLGCARGFPSAAGLFDLRLESDRYLDLDSERIKAERLHALEPESDVRGLSAAYYAMTDDVLDARRGRFLRHIALAEARGAALAERLPRQGRILEIGCGTGGLLVELVRRGRSIVGVDIAARWLVVARRRLTDHGLSTTLAAASAERLPWPDQQFDTVVADSVLEHLDNPARALREWARVLRPGGTLAIWSPNRYALTIDPHVGLWGIGLMPRRWVPGYLRLRARDVWPPRTLSASEARRLAQGAGFAEVAVDVPPIADEWARVLSPSQRIAVKAFSLARELGATRSLLRVVGPLWELRATKKGAA
jgi:SAM-dependent methyltransferase